MCMMHDEEYSRNAKIMRKRNAFRNKNAKINMEKKDFSRFGKNQGEKLNGENENHSLAFPPLNASREAILGPSRTFSPRSWVPIAILLLFYMQLRSVFHQFTENLSKRLRVNLRFTRIYVFL